MESANKDITVQAILKSWFGCLDHLDQNPNKVYPDSRLRPLKPSTQKPASMMGSFGMQIVLSTDLLLPNLHNSFSALGTKTTQTAHANKCRFQQPQFIPSEFTP